MKSVRLFNLSCSLICVLTGSLLAQNRDNTARRDPQPQVRYPLSSDSLPQANVPKGRLEGPFLFRSSVIADTVRKYWVYVPSQYEAAKPACVLVFQDGARAINPNGVLRVDQVLENLIAKQQIPVTIGIFITPGQRGATFPEEIGTGNPDNRDREYDVLDDTYARFIVDEMLPEVGKKYNLTTDPAGRAIGGSSSGAICAFTVAWHRPDQFRNVVSMIGSYTNIHGGHVYPDLVRKADRKPIRIFLQDGEQDLRSPNDLDRDWYLQNKKMVAALTDKGYDMAHVFGSGGHSDDHGGAMLPLMLRWIWRDYPGVESTQVDLVAEASTIVPEKIDLFPGFNATAQIDPSGAYHWERQFGGQRIQSKLSVTLKDGKLSGVVEVQRGDQSPVSTELINPVLIGNKMMADASSQFRDREFITTYQGIVSATGIEGWQLTEFGGQPRDTKWSAVRVSLGELLKPTNQRDSWVFELAGDGQGEMKVEGDAVVFSTTKLSSDNWHVQAYQADLDLQEGATYVLTFQAKSPSRSSIGISAMLNQEDWHEIGLQEELEVDAEYGDYSRTFIARNVIPGKSRLGFVLGLKLGTVLIKNMSLIKK